MRISATGTSRRTGATGSQAGFSLIELLVVLFIMALLTGVVAWTFPSAGEEAGKEIEAISGRFQAAADASTLRGVPIGVRLDGQGYRFYSYRRGLWQTLEDSTLFAPRAWPDDLMLVRFESETSKVDTAQLTEDEQETGFMTLPQIRFDSVGQATPFEIVFDREGDLFRIAGDRTGAVTSARAER